MSSVMSDRGVHLNGEEKSSAQVLFSFPSVGRHWILELK